MHKHRYVAKELAKMAIKSHETLKYVLTETTKDLQGQTMCETMKDMTEKTMIRRRKQCQWRTLGQRAQRGTECETPEEDLEWYLVLQHLDHSAWANAMHVFIVAYRLYALLCCVLYTLLK